MSWVTGIAAIGGTIVKNYSKIKQVMQRYGSKKALQQKKPSQAKTKQQQEKTPDAKTQAHNKADKMRGELKEKGMAVEGRDAGKEAISPDPSPATNESGGGNGRYRAREPWQDSHYQSPDNGHDNSYDQGMEV